MAHPVYRMCYQVKMMVEASALTPLSILRAFFQLKQSLIIYYIYYTQQNWDTGGLLLVYFVQSSFNENLYYAAFVSVCFDLSPNNCFKKITQNQSQH